MLKSEVYGYLRQNKKKNLAYVDGQVTPMSDHVFENLVVFKTVNHLIFQLNMCHKVYTQVTFFNNILKEFNSKSVDIITTC